jgi:Cu2+-exporting ATPase
VTRSSQARSISQARRFRATEVGADTALAQIVRLVETAQNSKAPAQRLADRAAHYLTLIAVGSGVLTFIVWLLVAREPLLLALTFAVTAVVIACPDALGLATPTAVMVATELAAKRGVLFKEARSLELASRIQVVVFDKTGTLTEGKPRVSDIVAAGLSEEELRRLAAAAEARSGHPLADAVLEAMQRRGLANALALSDFKNLPGYGIRATVGGREILVGARRLLERFDVPLGQLAERAEHLQSEGKSLIFVAIDRSPAGIIAAADTVRPTAIDAISQLKAIGIEPVMMTGDNGL